MIQMEEFGRDVCQMEIQELVEEMKAKEMLSDEVREEVNSLLKEGQYSKAGRLAVDFRSQRQTFAD